MKFLVSPRTPSRPRRPQPAAEWSYYGKKGPSSWGKLDPGYSACSKGKLQSPIDIHGAKRNPLLKPIEFHYIQRAGRSPSSTPAIPCELM